MSQICCEKLVCTYIWLLYCVYLVNWRVTLAPAFQVDGDQQISRQESGCQFTRGQGTRSKCAKARSTLPETETRHVEKLTEETQKLEAPNLEGPDSKIAYANNLSTWETRGNGHGYLRGQWIGDKGVRVRGAGPYTGFRAGRCQGTGCWSVTPRC